MSRYLYKLLAFVLPFIAIVVMLFVIGSRSYQFTPSEMYYYKEFEAAFTEKDFDVITLGNSKVLSALHKETLEENKQHKVVKLGYSSANTSTSKLILESYLNNCTVDPKIIFFEISWFTFNTSRTHFHDVAAGLFLTDFKLWNHYYEYDGGTLQHKIKEEWKQGFKEFLGTQSKRKEITYDVRFRPSCPDSVNYKFVIEVMEGIFPDYIAGIDEVLLRDFHSTVKMCADRDITLVLFTAPEDKEYSACQEDWEPIRNIFVEAAKQNDKVYYLDYTISGDLYDEKFDKWLKDSHHINENDLFTKEFIKDIKDRVPNSIYLK